MARGALLVKAADGALVARGSFRVGAVAPGETAAFVLENFGGDAVTLRFYGETGCCAWDSFSKPFETQATQKRGVDGS